MISKSIRVSTKTQLKGVLNEFKGEVIVSLLYSLAIPWRNAGMEVGPKFKEKFRHHLKWKYLVRKKIRDGKRRSQDWEELTEKRAEPGERSL
jgi:hypothetical protein